MERTTYCRHCNEKHIVSETMDSAGSVVGMFCNRKQRMVTVHSTKWNDDDVHEPLQRYLAAQVDVEALSRIKSEKLDGLARKMSYLFLQTPYAKERRLNYFWTQAIALDIIRRMKERQFHVKRGV